MNTVNLSETLDNLVRRGRSIPPTFQNFKFQAKSYDITLSIKEWSPGHATCETHTQRASLSPRYH